MKNLNRIYENLSLYVGMLYSAKKIAMWGFGMDGHLYYTSCPDEELFLESLEQGGSLSYALSPVKYKNNPLLLRDTMGFFYFADYVRDHGRPTMLVVIGPGADEEALRPYGAMLRYLLTGEAVDCYQYEAQPVKQEQDPPGKVPKQEVSGPVKSCQEYIRKHATGGFSLDDLAAEVGYTKYYLTRKFKQETGVSLQDYVKMTRVKIACIWLDTTDKSIQQISDDLNFCTSSYFSKVFTGQLGMSPLQYRAQNTRRRA